jgi:putative MFS transporter
LSSPSPPPLDAYQKRLVAFLSVATFFEGYDFFAVAQILPTLRAEFGLDPAGAGVMIAVINAGTVAAGLLVRLADRWGRRRVLSLTIAGYTLFSLLTATTHSALTFGLAQLGARVFLIGEWAVAMVMAAEEFPAERRGTVIGVIQACATLGGITCAGLVPLFLRTPLGWRAVYVAGAVPLVLTAFARRGLRETRRFAARASVTMGPQAAPNPGALEARRAGPLALLRGPYRRRVLVLGAIWTLTYTCTQNATIFWKEFAVSERGLSDAAVGVALSAAALGAMPLVFLCGKLLDVAGRRRGGAVIFVAGAVGVALSYTLTTSAPLTVALILAVFGTNAALPVLNAYTAELFPTEARADAFALANNALGRVGYVLSPIAVGAAAGVFGWGRAVAATSLSMLAALALILWLLPETRGRELEETSRAP